METYNIFYAYKFNLKHLSSKYFPLKDSCLYSILPAMQSYVPQMSGKKTINIESRIEGLTFYIGIKVKSFYLGEEIDPTMTNPCEIPVTSKAILIKAWNECKITNQANTLTPAFYFLK